MTGIRTRCLVAVLLTCAACGNGDSPTTPRPVVADALAKAAPPDAATPDLAPDRPVDLPYNWVGAPDASGREVFSTGTPYALPDGGIRTIVPDAGRLDAPAPTDAARDVVATDVVARLCRRETETCMRTAECCAGVTCQKGRCVRGCGDGVCGPDESRDTCCRDCACGAGTYCSPTTLACLAPVVLMSFTFTHACMTEPGPIEMRVFDDSNGLVFPGGSDRYVLPKDGTETFTIQCVPGDRICYGAAAGGGRSNWGAGLTGNLACSGCCGTCSFGDVSLNLVCR